MMHTRQLLYGVVQFTPSCSQPPLLSFTPPGTPSHSTYIGPKSPVELLVHQFRCVTEEHNGIVPNLKHRLGKAVPHSIDSGQISSDLQAHGGEHLPGSRIECQLLYASLLHLLETAQPTEN